ncbi:MAG: methyltransferase domain-containing protein [Actinomycetota bacterium]|nr:methyltransferase domain-containing protein [Actinomycetota bacterium]
MLDVGCGTGRWSAALAERTAAVTAVEPVAEMREEARKRGVDAIAARAESLPFADGSFERALLALVAHVVDRPRALGEVRRVLEDVGRVAIVTFDRAQFERYYLNRFFPSLREIDDARFPDRATLARELVVAGFEPRFVDHRQHSVHAREWVLERLRGRFISTLQRLSAAEFEEGVARAERELPDSVEAEQHWLLAVGSVRPPL